MEDETGGNHEREEDVEADGDSEVGKAKVYGDPLPQVRIWLGGDVESDDTHRFWRGGSLASKLRIFVERYPQIEAM